MGTITSVNKVLVKNLHIAVFSWKKSTLTLLNLTFSALQRFGDG